MNPRLFLSLVCLPVALLSGCASFAPSLPENYDGPRATIQDSALATSGSKVDFFVVAKVDGRTILNSRIESIAANQGRGFVMEPVVLSHAVPAQPLEVEVVGRTEYAAPILALTHPVYQVVGTVRFTPQPDGRYVVRGALADDSSSVWIEDAETGELVGEKVLVVGSAKLGFFQK